MSDGRGEVRTEQPVTGLDAGRLFGAHLFAEAESVEKETTELGVDDAVPVSGQQQETTQHAGSLPDGSQLFGSSFLFTDVQHVDAGSGATQSGSRPASQTGPGPDQPEQQNTNTDWVLDHLEMGYEEQGRQAVLASGKTVVLKRRKRRVQTQTEMRAGERNHFGVPIHQLLMDVEAEAAGGTGALPKAKKPPVASRHGSVLLSEKYRPKRYTDLLGPEATHRRIMRWLSAWRNVVFERGEPVSDDVANSGDRDALGRPHKKILLIHGPPGIGKTTLAHVVARQGGYEVMEINASDERAGPAVREKVQSALTSHQINKSRRPVCIVADEVEGAADSGNGFVQMLVDLIKGDERALEARLRGGTTAQNKTGHGGGGRKKPMLLARPIVCICNDVYGRSLRTLRQHAEVVAYGRSSDAALVTRLRDVCKTEGIKLDTRRLAQIVEMCEGDMRACLNAIDWAAGQNSDATTSIKDMSRAWTQVATRVFRRTGSATKAAEMPQVLAQLHDCGEYDRVIAACFAMYPTMQWADDMLGKPAALGDWLHFYESTNAGIYERQHGALAEYLGYPGLAFFSLFSSAGTSRDAPFSRGRDYEVYEAIKHARELSREITEKAHPELRLLFPPPLVAQELSPALLRIVSPSLDDHGASRTADRARVSHAAELMRALGLRFRRMHLDDGSLVLRVEPALEQLAAFGDDAQTQAAVGKYTARQQIFEIMQKMSAGPKPEDGPALATKRSASDTSNDPKPKKPRDGPKTDIWGLAVNDSSRAGTPGIEDHASQRVWVQYVEGFSNAVRKDISWADLWLI